MTGWPRSAGCARGLAPGRESQQAGIRVRRGIQIGELGKHAVLGGEVGSALLAIELINRYGFNQVDRGLQCSRSLVGLLHPAIAGGDDAEGGHSLVNVAALDAGFRGIQPITDGCVGVTSQEH